MKILFCAYRDWALDSIKNLHSHGDYLIIQSKKDLETTCSTFKPELIFFIGWSWYVPKHIIDSYTCLCIHPSKLPKYRGGSPIQNQIIDGIKESAVTLFIMDYYLDSGDIILQEKLNLEGELIDILKRISYISCNIINKVLQKYYINKKITGRKQNHDDATFCTRRTPSDSEITLNDLNTLSAEQLYNKIRCLQDPYPNAYITLGSGEKLYILKTKYENKFNTTKQK